mmetsp:Transcript_144512/g.360227  ORF Transcript_144512/g.360227 Transcript_144512/m.360227 type:complete len:203 (-) Transcript_144512:1008-1616(-)
MACRQVWIAPSISERRAPGTWFAKRSVNKSAAESTSRSGTSEGPMSWKMPPASINGGGAELLGTQSLASNSRFCRRSNLDGAMGRSRIFTRNRSRTSSLAPRTERCAPHRAAKPASAFLGMSRSTKPMATFRIMYSYENARRAHAPNTFSNIANSADRVKSSAQFASAVINICGYSMSKLKIMSRNTSADLDGLAEWKAIER